MKKELENINQIGKLCPLCEKGVIIYFSTEINEWLFGKAKIEGICCSNEKCSAYIKIN